MKPNLFHISLLAFFIICAQTQSLIASQPGYWGDWNGWKGVQPGYYLCGAEIRFEDNQGNNGDDTAANGVRLIYCNAKNWSDQKQYKFDGLWGEWKGVKMCPLGFYVDAFRARVEPPQGDGDDTALNGLEFRCRNRDGFHNFVKIYEGLWGTWRDWHFANFDSGPFLFTTYQVRFEGSQGNGDDTALNGLQFYSERVYLE